MTERPKATARFELVFEKLDELADDVQELVVLSQEVEGQLEELDEIAELRRLALALTESAPGSYTTT